MLSALGCSAMQRAAAYLRSRGLSLDGVELRVSADPTESGLGEVAIDVEAPGLTARKREAILKSIDASTIYQALVKPQTVRLGLLTSVAEKDAGSVADGEAAATVL